MLQLKRKANLHNMNIKDSVEKGKELNSSLKH